MTRSIQRFAVMTAASLAIAMPTIADAQQPLASSSPAGLPLRRTTAVTYEARRETKVMVNRYPSAELALAPFHLIDVAEASRLPRIALSAAGGLSTSDLLRPNVPSEFWLASAWT